MFNVVMNSILENKADWQAHFASGWLAHFQQTGDLDWKQYQRPKNNETVQGKGIDLSHSRLLLISTAGGYLKKTQAAFDAPNPLGDYSLRVFPVSSSFDDIAYAHEHYDHAAVDADPQVLLPLNHLDYLVAENKIGELCEDVLSFSGYQPDCGRLIDELIPEIVQQAHRQKAQGALLVPA